MCENKQYSIFIGKNKREADGLVNYKAAKRLSDKVYLLMVMSLRSKNNTDKLQLHKSIGNSCSFKSSPWNSFAYQQVGIVILWEGNTILIVRV